MFNLNEGIYYSLKFSERWQMYLVLIAFVLVSIAISYLLGSINSAIIVSRVLYRDDIRKHGSGNAGLTNMLRTYGGRAAVFTLLGDILKTALAILVTAVLFGFHYNAGVSTDLGFCYMAALFVMYGHIFPIYYGFKGGKGVLCTATAALILSPVPFLILLTIFVIIVAISRYVSLGSVTVAVLYPVVLNAYYKIVFGAESPIGMFTAISTIILAVTIVVCHKENLKRISNRTERKLSFGKKKNADEESEK